MKTLSLCVVGLSLMLAVSASAASATSRPATAPDFSAVTSYMDTGWPSLCTSSDVLRQLGFGFSGEMASSGVDI